MLPDYTATLRFSKSPSTALPETGTAAGFRLPLFPYFLHVRASRPCLRFVELTFPLKDPVRNVLGLLGVPELASLAGGIACLVFAVLIHGELLA